MAVIITELPGVIRSFLRALPFYQPGGGGVLGDAPGTGVFARPRAVSEIGRLGRVDRISTAPPTVRPRSEQPRRAVPRELPRNRPAGYWTEQQQDYQDYLNVYDQWVEAGCDEEDSQLCDLIGDDVTRAADKYVEKWGERAPLEPRRPGGVVPIGGPAVKVPEVPRAPPSEFEKLIRKPPVSDLDRLIRGREFVPKGGTVAKTAARVVGRAAILASAPLAVLIGVLTPGSLGDLPPPFQKGPTARRGVRGRRPPSPRPDVPSPRRVPSPRTSVAVPSPVATVVPAPAPRAPTPSARPARVARPQPAPAPSSAPAPAPRATSSPLPQLLFLPFPGLGPNLSTFALPSFAPFPGAGFAPPGQPSTRPRTIPRTTSQFRPSPATRTSPLGDLCQPSKATRTRRKRCTNPIISKSVSGNIQTIKRRLQCP